MPRSTPLVLTVAASIAQVALCASFLRHNSKVANAPKQQLVDDQAPLATPVAHVAKPSGPKNITINGTVIMSSLSTAPVFEDIAARNAWGSHESISGPGSEMAATETVRATLGRWIQEHNVQLFMDIPCGDANWQGSIPGLDMIKYQGFDIAHTAVKNAKAKNQHRTFMSFSQFDLTKGVPPGKPNIFMVRDVIQHVPLDLGYAMLLNVKRTGVRWLAVTSWKGGTNININPGEFFKNDVHQPPFNLPMPVDECINYDGLVQRNHDPHMQDYLELIDLSQWHPNGL